MLRPPMQAAASEKSAPPCARPVPPGCTTTRTPAKPARTAIQDRRETFSPSRGAASRMTTSGRTKEMAVASASGISRKPMKDSISIAVMVSACVRCRGRSLVRSRCRLPVITRTAISGGRAKAFRKKTIWFTGKRAA